MTTVIELKSFQKSVKKIMNAAEVKDLIEMLRKNPAAGDIIKGTGGARKLRVALGNKGKSGGARVIHYFANAEDIVTLITAYTKGDKESLTKAEINALKALINDLKKGYQP